MMKMKKVHCDTHGSSTGYVICKHIVEGGEPVRVVTEPSKKGQMGAIGSIVCGRDADDHGIDDLVLVCSHCAQKNGWTRPAAKA